MAKIRKNSAVICGGAYGDEGKGRIVDALVAEFAQKGKIVVYRDNGGSNAGHTVEFGDKRIALHQLPSGVFFKNAAVVLGKGMVLHPADLLLEMELVKEVAGQEIPAEIKIDEMAVLSLDTHRAFEGAVKALKSGNQASTGRGISPAYADILYGHPLRMRDIKTWQINKLRRHYKLYQKLVRGLGFEIETMRVAALDGSKHQVASEQEFLANLKRQVAQLKPMIQDVRGFIETTWSDEEYSYIFEKSQAIGLDARWGVYPDVTSSDTTPAGIYASSEGVVDPEQIPLRAGVIKATYMSSVGVRKLPTIMEEELASRIREDAHEYGATTGRPRDVVYLDLPAIKYYARVGKLTHLVLTHMDIVYPGQPVKICDAYLQGKKKAGFKPDQDYLNTVQPRYREMQPWDLKALRKAKNRQSLPAEARRFLSYIEKEVGLPVFMITTGPERGAEIRFES